MALTLLAVDTSTEAGSVAVWHRQQTQGHSLFGVRQHGAWLMTGIQQLLAEQSLALSQVDALVLGAGPGGFTGIRVATGVVQGLAFALDKPVILASTLQALAQAAWQQRQEPRVLAALDARMGELYLGLYQHCAGLMQPVCPDNLAAPEQLLPIPDPVYGVGSGWPVFREALTASVQAEVRVEAEVSYPLAEFMLAKAIDDWQQQCWVTAAEVQPRYLRDKVTWNKLPGRQ